MFTNIIYCSPALGGVTLGKRQPSNLLNVNTKM